MIGTNFMLMKFPFNFLIVFIFYKLKCFSFDLQIQYYYTNSFSFFVHIVKYYTFKILLQFKSHSEVKT